jgi:glycosyltransferase involved in cell wall biosynthesis/Flp pilus assembly protein TadD
MDTASNRTTSRRLSVAMIVRDEQDVLASTISSVRGIADEMVAVDTGSADHTVALARRLGVRVTAMPWADDFSAARNRCIEEVTGDWVLWLDAGERMDPEWAGILRTFVDQEADPGKVYALMIELPPADPRASSEQAARPRLMPRRAELRFEGRVRETLKPSIEAAGMSVALAPGRIIGHCRIHDPRRKLKRAQRNLTIVAQENAGHQQPPVRLLLAMGEALGDLSNQTEARRAFRQAIQSSLAGSTDMLEAYYGLLTTYEGDRGKDESPLAACIRALEAFPLDAQLLCALGNYLQLDNRIDLASRAFENAVKYGQIDMETWHLTEITQIAAICLGLTLQLQQKDDQALAVLGEVLQRCGPSARVCRHLIDLHVKHGRLDEALAAADVLPSGTVEQRPFRDAIRGACLAVEKDWSAALAYLQSAYLGGCNEPLCLRWLSVTLLSRGQIEAVEPILRRWQQVEPNNTEVHAYLAALKSSQMGETGTAEAHRRSGAELPATPAPDPSRQLRIDPGLKTPSTAIPPLSLQPPLAESDSQSATA